MQRHIISTVETKIITDVKTDTRNKKMINKRSKIDMWLPLDTNTKSYTYTYMENPTPPSETLGEFGRSKSRLVLRSRRTVYYTYICS